MPFFLLYNRLNQQGVSTTMFKSIIKASGLIGSLLLLLTLGYSTISQGQSSSTSVHLTMGNPSGATTNTANSNNYLLVKPQYALSYNNSRKIPNWVSWQLNRSWLGSIPRCRAFNPDSTLPVGWYRVLPTEYTNSGFDRGHMTPSGDRRANRRDNCATFLMTNIIPQTPDNNQGPWEKLESHSRELVDRGRELYIISGGYETQRTIATSRIAVPQQTWKVVVVLDRPGQGVSGVTTSTRVIAVDMPNRQGIRDDNWTDYQTTVDEIESATGYDLLSNVPTSIQNVIEARR